MRRVVFLDIDGTLIDVPAGLSEPSIYTKYAINELIKNGDLVFIATGRFKGNIPEIIKSLNPSGYITSNGAYIEYEGKELYSKEFNKDVFNDVRKFCLDNNCLFTGESQDFVYTPSIDQRFLDYLKKWKIEYVKYTNDDNNKFYKCCVFLNNISLRNDFEKKIGPIADARAQTADPEALAYDINEIGINKGFAVNKVIEMLNIDKNNTYCFCDGINDLELIKACKYSYAMENGDDKVKNIAFGQTYSAIKDGVYRKLVEIGLIKGIS